jgi:hypothetical protein
LRGFVHAHVGWLFRHDQRGSRARYATDLLADPVIRFVDRTFVLWALGGLALAFGLGVVIGGSLTAGLSGLLQGKRARRQSDPARPLRTSTRRPRARDRLRPRFCIPGRAAATHHCSLLRSAAVPGDSVLLIRGSSQPLGGAGLSALLPPDHMGRRPGGRPTLCVGGSSGPPWRLKGAEATQSKEDTG